MAYLILESFLTKSPYGQRLKKERSTSFSVYPNYTRKPSFPNDIRNIRYSGSCTNISSLLQMSCTNLNASNASLTTSRNAIIPLNFRHLSQLNKDDKLLQDVTQDNNIDNTSATSDNETDKELAPSWYDIYNNNP